MSFKTEVIADSSGKWVGNGLRFERGSEAMAYVEDLAGRWTSVRQTRIVEVPDEQVTHTWDIDRARAVALPS